MKKNIFALFLIIAFMGCEKPIKEEPDYRNFYTGKFHFTTLHSPIVMCYHPPSPDSNCCVNGWRVMYTDTVHYWSNVLKEDTERIKIQFGDGIITVNDKGDTIYKTIFPIINSNDILTLPEYPTWGHNRFEGSYIGKDTINIIMQVGGMIGGYDKYEIVGIRMLGNR